MWESHVRHRWNVRNGGHELANHPLRGALISNYLIKICLRRGAHRTPPSCARPAPFACFAERGGGPVFKRSKVDLTSRRRCEEGRRGRGRQCTREYVPNLRSDRIKTVDNAIPYDTLRGYRLASLSFRMEKSCVKLYTLRIIINYR